MKTRKQLSGRPLTTSSRHRGDECERESQKMTVNFATDNVHEICSGVQCQYLDWNTSTVQLQVFICQDYMTLNYKKFLANQIH